MRNLLTHFPWLFGTPPVHRVDVDKYGVTLTLGHKVSLFLWHEVERIDAYKQDLFTRDDVVFAFQLKAPKPVVEISEELEGYAALVHFLEAEWPKISPDWRNKVILPPFAECRTTLYSTLP